MSRATVVLARCNLPQAQDIQTYDPSLYKDTMNKRDNHTSFIDGCDTSEDNFKKICDEDVLRLRNRAGLGRVCVCGDQTASDMATEVASWVSQKGLLKEVTGTGVIIYCHSTPDEETSISPACRMQYALGNKRAIPFSISQQHGTSIFTALYLVDVLFEISVADYAVVFGVDKWVSPLNRYIPDVTFLGDGAGALVLRQDDYPGLRLVDVAIKQITGGPGLDAIRQSSHSFPMDEIVNHLYLLINDLLNRNATTIEQIRYIVFSHMNRQLAAKLHESLMIDEKQIISNLADDFGYVSTADTILGLEHLLVHYQLEDKQFVLVWNVGFEGNLACALFLYHSNKKPTGF